MDALGFSIRYAGEQGGRAGVTGNASWSPGSVCWVDVSSTDPAGSREFYSGLFSWTYQINSRPGRRQYLIALCGGRPVAGLSGAAVPADHRAAWTLYLASADVMRTAQVLDPWGGRVLLGPTDVPGHGTVLIGADPTGGVIGFWQPARPWMFRRTAPGALYFMPTWMLQRLFLWARFDRILLV